MFQNNLKTAYRYLKNHKQFALINVIGLTFGFYCFFLLNAYVLRESSFDTDHENVYRLLEIATEENGNIRESAQLAPAIARKAARDFDEIETQTQILPIGRTDVGNDPETVSHEPIVILCHNFPAVFNFPFIEGTLTNESNGIVLTQSIKEKYFGKEPALGKVLKTGYGEHPIVAVYKDFPENSHLINQIFFTETVAKGIFDEWEQAISGDFENRNFISYFKLNPQTDLSALNTKIENLTIDNYPAAKTFNSSFKLQAVQDIHLYQNEVEGEINNAKGNGLYVKLFFWIGLIILIVACFNYAGLLNIAFMDRAKEINLRQMMGSGKLQLLRQFLAESMLLTSISILLAFLILLLSKSSVQNLFNTTLNLTEIPLKGLVFMLITGLFISFLAVAYPFYLIVKNDSYRNQLSASKLPFRRVMLVFQFVAVISFLMASIVFNKQLDFLKNREIGFQKEGLAMIDVNSRVYRQRFQALKTEFLRIPEVESLSVSSRVPGEWKNIPIVKASNAGQNREAAKDALFIGADEDFLKTFQIKLLKGENFRGLPADSSKVLINEAAAKALGLSEPVGQNIDIPAVNYGGSLNELDQTFKVSIAGVVKDFQMEDFRTTVKPLIISNWNNPIHSIDYYTLKINATDWQKTRTAIEEVNDLFAPESPVEFNVLDAKFDRFLATDLSRFKLLNFFSGIIVLLAFMGLFAMSAYVAKSRTKEIGIRKVLGSSISQIVTLLSADFVKLVFVGLLIATPITWYLLNQWLTDFAYQIQIKWWMAAVATLGCLVLTLGTVSFQAIKGALANPVKSLKSE
ncbi:ABC transporter permease [uncultured Arcticibacterium sp.]|uniref:ABC transporter permease n=1 Tax=uncultured Arcticibacterium sp. TaxID=2173042 RepID=UPI0030FAFF8F